MLKKIEPSLRLSICTCSCQQDAKMSTMGSSNLGQSGNAEKYFSTVKHKIKKPTGGCLKVQLAFLQRPLNLHCTVEKVWIVLLDVVEVWGAEEAGAGTKRISAFVPFTVSFCIVTVVLVVSTFADVFDVAVGTTVVGLKILKIKKFSLIFGFFKLQNWFFLASWLQ